MIYRILVVEDDPTIQRELVTLLQGLSLIHISEPTRH